MENKLNYFIDGVEVNEEYFEEELGIAWSNNIEDSFDELLNDAYDSIDIMGITFDPSFVLYKCDPLAYNKAKEDLLTDNLDESLYLLKTALEEVTVDGKVFKCEESN